MRSTPCRRLPAMAPFSWLQRGWRDLRRAPRQSLTQGAVIAPLSWRVAGLGLVGGFATPLLLSSGPDRPLGLFGIAYWYAVLPLHGIVFPGMLKGIVRSAGLTNPKHAD